MLQRFSALFAFYFCTQSIVFGVVDINTNNKRLFSSRSIYHVGHNLIVYGDKVVMQSKVGVLTDAEILAERIRLKEEFTKLVIEADENGEPPPDPHKFIEANAKPDIGYIYRTPEDGCYFLENGFRFCTMDGRITKVLQGIRNDYIIKDFFFHDSNERCKMAAYHVMYNYLYKERPTLFHQYQLLIQEELYPALIRVIILDTADLLTPEEIDNTSEESLARGGGVMRGKDLPKGNLIAIYVSETNGIGCLPFNKLKLPEEGSSMLFPLHLSAYKLIEEWFEGFDKWEDKFLVMSDSSPSVTMYHQWMLNKASHAKVMTRGKLTLPPLKTGYGIVSANDLSSITAESVRRKQ